MTASYKKSSVGLFDVGDDGYNGSSLTATTTAVPTDFGTWTDNDDADCATYQRLHTFMGHTNYIYMNDQSAVGACIWECDWTAGEQTSGTMEFYMATSDVTKEMVVIIQDGANSIIGLRISDSNWDVLNDPGAPEWTEIADLTPENNTWYHVSIRWESTAGAYQGLAEDDFKIFIDGVEYGDYNFAQAGDPDGFYISTQDAPTGFQACWDAFSGSWVASYAIGDNLDFIVDTTLTASSVYKCAVSGKVMDYKKATMIIDDSEGIVKGTKIQVTDTYSVGGATASAVIFEGMVTTITSTSPTECEVESLAKEDLTNKPVAGTEAGRTDEIITAQTADINHVTDGTHEAGTAMGTLSFGGTKTYKQIWTNLAKMDGSIWYLWRDAGALKVNFNDYDTDTGVDIDQDDNIKLLDAGRPARRYTKTYVLGLDGATGSATASAADQANYGVNTYPHVDRTLSAALCGTCATNLLAVLNQDNYLVRFKYSISTIGYVQEGQTITFAYTEEGTETIESAQFIVWACEWGTVGQEGVLTLLKYPHYEWVDSQLIQENAEQIDMNVTYQTAQHDRILYPVIWVPYNYLTSGVNNVWWNTGGGTRHGKTSHTVGAAYDNAVFLIPDDADNTSDWIVGVDWTDQNNANDIDWQIDVLYASDGGAQATEETLNDVWTGAAGAWFYNMEEETFTPDHISPGDVVTIRVQCEDDNNVTDTFVVGIYLKIKVTGRT